MELGKEYFGPLWSFVASNEITDIDYNGKEIKSWTGKFDISESENEIFFDDANGKRVVIHGGIVICEEN